ncbi:MAG: hemerythrin domain-containing protein [Methylovulum sp.]|nr:hemerythrin domain-containing protein [Methylovulum sp.]
MKFEWKNEYALGNTLIDNEHQHLFNLANTITQCPTNDGLINNAMQLYRHARKHFDHEEKLMREHAYPYYGQHVENHNELLAGLISKSEAIKEGNWSKADIVKLMAQWVLHITSDDGLIRDHLQLQLPCIVPTLQRGNAACDAPASRNAERCRMNSHAGAWELCKNKPSPTTVPTFRRRDATSGAGALLGKRVEQSGKALRFGYNKPVKSNVGFYHLPSGCPPCKHYP